MPQTLLAPDLSDAAILRATAAIRPCRRGGLRLESTTLALAGRSKPLIHNYGHGGCGVTLSWGTAHEAANLVEAALEFPSLPRSQRERATPSSLPQASSLTPQAFPVGVLGGGVVALTTAHELLQRGYPVTLYAEHLAGETTSNTAGSLWLPTGLDFPTEPAARARLNAMLARAHARFVGEGQRWGAEELPVYEPAHAPFCPEHFESGAIHPPTPIDPLPVGSATQPGKVFRTLFIHTPRFLRTLLGEVRSMGGTVVMRRFERADELLDLPEALLVNCLALGSRTLFDDDAMQPTRGVLVHLRPQPLGYIVHDGYKYLFPREDALVLGGSFEPGITDPTPPDATVREILAHHRRFFGPDPRRG